MFDEKIRTCVPTKRGERGGETVQKRRNLQKLNLIIYIYDAYSVQKSQ
jgi:hypothetical protein